MSKAKQTSSFTITNLVGERAMVEGTDFNGAVGQTTVSTSQWDEIVRTRDLSAATSEFDKAVEAHFESLTQAAEKIRTGLEVQVDDLATVTLSEPVQGVASEKGDVRVLTRDTIILRAINEGRTDRLVWVGGELEVTTV